MKGNPALQAYGLALLAGLASGLVSLSAAKGGSGALLAFLAPLPLVSIGLTQGRIKLLTAVASASVLVVAVAEAPWAALFAHFLLGSLPALVFVLLALLARRSSDGVTVWFPVGALVSWLTVVALVLAMVACIGLPTGDGRIETWVADFVTRALDEAAPTAPPEVRALMAKVWGAFFPAMAGAGWLMLAVANGWVGLKVAAKSGRTLRPAPDLLALTLPVWLLAPLVMATGLGFSAGGDVGFLARNAAALLLTPYVIFGVTVVHRALRQRSNGGFLLPLFYVVFFLVSPWSMVGLAGIGLVKQLTGLRPQERAASQEDE